jgi:hypothetical protein
LAEIVQGHWPPLLKLQVITAEREGFPVTHKGEIPFSYFYFSSSFDSDNSGFLSGRKDYSMETLSHPQNSVWKNRSFVVLFSSALFVAFSAQIYNLALPLLVYGSIESTKNAGLK